MPTAAERFAEFAGTLTYADIPPSVVYEAKYHLLDTLGCGLAAWGLGAASAGVSAVAKLGGAGRSSAIGFAAGLPAEQAAFANGMLTHGLDYDDTHPGSICHVSAVVCPSAVAVAEALRTDGRNLITAIVAGNEVVTRVGRAVPGEFHKRGFHPTGICGIFGAVVAAGLLQRLSKSELVSALGLAGSMGSGIFAYLQDGSDAKTIHPGWAAQGGITAAALASEGATGPAGVFEGRFGLYDSYLGLSKETIGLDLDDLGREWETEQMAYKLYPSCHHMHGVLSAIAVAAGGAKILPEDVDGVTVKIPTAAVPIIAEPSATKVAPRTEYDARFSLQYCVAQMLVMGAFDATSYMSDSLSDPRVAAMARLVRYEQDDFVASQPTSFPGAIEVRLKDGRELKECILDQRGTVRNPLGATEVVEKYRANARLALRSDNVAELEDAVLNVERVDDLETAFSVLRAARAGQSTASVVAG